MSRRQRDGERAARRPLASIPASGLGASSSALPTDLLQASYSAPWIFWGAARVPKL